MSFWKNISQANSPTNPLNGFGRGVDFAGTQGGDLIVKGPWSDPSAQQEESFFLPIEIDAERWSKLYPYRLLVVQQDPTGKTFSPVASGNAASAIPKITELSTDRFQISYQPMTSKWEYQLPITPQQLSITNQFAINTSATLRGIVEEHGGTKFKIINCAGSFGVWPYRRSLSDAPSQSSTFVQSLFAGTLQAFQGVSNQVSRLSSLLNGGKHPANKPPIVNENNSAGGFFGTGYTQALILDQFLEQYAELKKSPKAANYRLALDIPKQNQTYLVTPMQFTYSQAADSPNEYKFSLQLKAYRRVSLSGDGASSVTAVPTPLSSNTLQNVLNSVTEARRTLGAAYNLVRAVRSDVNGPFNALRETSLFIKGLSGLVAAVVDLPENILADAKFAIADSLANLEQADYQRLAIRAKLGGSLQAMRDFKKEREGQPLPNTISDNPALIGSQNYKTSPINNVFDSPDQNFDLFNAIDTTSVNFPSSVQDAIDSELDRTSLLTVDDLQKHKATLQELAYQISNAFGTGDDTFSQIYKRAAPKERLQPISIDEFDILKKLYDAIQGLGILTLNDDLNQNQNAAYEFVKAEAEDAGIPFEDSSTKIRVPVPFGLTMEQIAARYLGDQERWLEIATINALKSPYIDEEGFIRSFLSNGDGRQFNINSDEDLYVGQSIVLLSDTQPRQRRKIIDIEQINETNYLVTVDGLDNLDSLTLPDNARIQAYLPGTVNSQDQIFVPSDLPVSDDLVTRPIPSTQEDSLTGLSKVDLLLTSDNDIAINSLGDFRLSYGLTNLFQALKLKFITEPGGLIRHPSYGSGLRPGISNADTTASDIYNTVAALVAQDPRYSGIQSFQVDIDGPVTYVKLSVFVANGLGVFPLSFKLAA